MLKNYFKIAIRNLAKQKGLAFINIVGLSAGIACFILFLLYAVNEFSFDRFHKNERSIYRVYEWTKPLDGSSPALSAIMPMPLGPAMKKDLPDVIDYVRIKPAFSESFLRRDNEVYRVKLSYADPQFFSFFSFPLKFGNPSTALKNINSIVVTASKAKELFGNENAIGQSIQIKIDDVFQPFVISAVAADIPANSSIRFDILGNFDFFETTQFGTIFNNWYTTAFRTYVRVLPGSSLSHDEKRLISFHRSYDPEAGSTQKDRPVAGYGLQPLRAMHTDTKLGDDYNVETIDPKTIWIILSIATGVLLIACINFTTLAIGRSAGRSKEVGIRKVIGAEKGQLVLQFLAESLLLSIFSTIIGLLLAKLLLPWFNQLAGRNLQFSFALYPEMSWLIAGLILLVGLLSGSYPALILSNFKVIEVLKNKMRIGGSNLFTRSLVTLQFVLSIGLIISTIIILQQTKYMTGKNPGFNKENVVVVDATQTDTKKIYPLFKQALASHTGINGISSASGGLGEGNELFGHGFKYKGAHKKIYEYLIDPDYMKVLGMQLVAGRNFDPLIADDTVTSVVINEAMVNDFGWTLNNAIGQQITGYTNSKTPVVIGVVRNFNFQPLTEKIQPQLFNQFAGNEPGNFFVRIQAGNPAPILANIQKTWNSVAPDAPFKYSFLDEDIDRFYKSEVRWSNIVGWASGIAIFLACLGLLGLAALAAVNRTKEIGIRKILGAPFVTIISLLSKDFLKLIFIAFIIASPTAWYFMNKWLQDYPDRIHIEWWVFMITGCATILIALLTVSFQAIKAAVANPVKSLRTE